MVLVLPLLLVLALGAYLAHRQAGYLAALGAFVVFLAAGCVIFVLLGAPGDRIGRVGGSVLMAIPLAGSASIAFSGRLWKRPWVALLLVPLVYALGLVAGVNVWMWLGLPH